MSNEYRDRIKKVKESRHHKVNNSVGINEAYRYFRKINKVIPEDKFRKVIKLVNILLQKQLANGEDIHFPYRMGYLELRKFKTKVDFVDNKLVTNLPVDWDKTLKLWESNPSAMQKKLLVRQEVPYVYRVFYKKGTANYNNKIFYEFSTNRELKKALKKNIIENKIDAFTFKT